MPLLLNVHVTNPEQSRPNALIEPDEEFPGAVTFLIVPHALSHPITDDLPPQK